MNWVNGAMVAFVLEGWWIVHALRRQRRRARSKALALYRPAAPPPRSLPRPGESLDAELGRAVVAAVDRYHELNAR